MNHYVRTEEEEAVLARAIRHLREFSLFREEYDVNTRCLDGKVFIGYRDIHSFAGDVLAIDLQIEGHTGFILNIAIPHDGRRRGYGRALYGCVEKLFKEMGCSKARVSASGIGRKFWPAMGFNRPINQIELEKAL